MSCLVKRIASVVNDSRPSLRSPVLWRCIRGVHGHGGHGSDLKPVHLDELPVPKGSWAAYHKAQNAKFNRHLMLGAGFFIFTVCYASRSRHFDFCFTPELPGDECALSAPPPPMPKKCPPKE